MSKKLLRAGVCFLVLLLPTVVRAQSGVVKAEGLPIPGVTVKATQGERILLTVTDDTGAFHIDKMSEGTWIVEADMFGFDHVRKEVQVGPTPVKIDLTMELRSVQQLRDRTGQTAGGRGNAGAAANSNN